MLRNAFGRRSLTAVNVAVKQAPSVAAGKDDYRVEREADTSKDLGARNEAAYFNYNPFTPTSLREKYAMPSLNNLMTSVAIEDAFIFGFSATVGVLAWAYYCNQKYETVSLPYPTRKEE
eukprot:TRINITY_DN3022_c0_g1_i1.p1 TRINITY_DN3022_c0_g1~~TRINITY_DN3022_c0_g1_i1.p1  ORF type:complete len:137 (+),score=38.22 TRINITY_DN3022_c0_g1_i1:55-411(+)